MPPEVAQHVLYRGAPEFRFEVDGARFPYYITQEGAAFTKLDDGFFKVTVTVLCGIRPDADGRSYRAAGVPFFSDDQDAPCSIGGLPFPWAISDDGILYHRGRHNVGEVELSFYTDALDTDAPVVDGTVTRMHTEPLGWAFADAPTLHGILLSAAAALWHAGAEVARRVRRAALPYP
jgi:hypothetical protein